MKLVFRKSTGEVVAVGMTLETKQLSTIEVPDDNRWKEGYKMFVENSVIRWEKPIKMQQEEKKQKLLADIDSAVDFPDLKNKLKNVISKLI